ncbi:NadR type nicotinamide-nucleotide adenylyltransferase [Thermoflavifilum aggregans]|uniref:NadR type nicotinamide-nucleotide adenylyltransferase n=1 Tax=Thermoflavifilum aggregans TaxID=454188 RepID=A0A2M9CTX7_9BACT|nr:ATP-binding protein [Thermoflavifilum aggregans]PJJ75331.1 NadR type nicotinamide-nucleotide adenylyltransferase [Thermoflavifilum aggregans]
MKKIVVIGPESTGKSTLSEQLAAHLHTVWVPEFARDYLNQLHRPYEEADLLAIARGQIQSEDRLFHQANRFLICDTDLYVIKVWSEHKYQTCHPWILQQIAQRTYDLYILTYIDIPWTYDPQREYPQPEMREYFFRIYRDIVIQSGTPWICVKGNEQERLQTALNGIHSLFPQTSMHP